MEHYKYKDFKSIMSTKRMNSAKQQSRNNFTNYYYQKFDGNLHHQYTPTENTFSNNYNQSSEERMVKNVYSPQYQHSPYLYNKRHQDILKQSPKMLESHRIKIFSNQSNTKQTSLLNFKSKQQILFQKIVQKRKNLNKSINFQISRQKDQFNQKKKIKNLVDENIKINLNQNQAYDRPPTDRTNKNSSEENYRKRIFSVKNQLKKLDQVYQKGQQDHVLIFSKIQKTKEIIKRYQDAETQCQITNFQSLLMKAQLLLNVQKKFEQQELIKSLESYIEQINLLFLGFKSYTGIQFIQFFKVIKANATLSPSTFNLQQIRHQILSIFNDSSNTKKQHKYYQQDSGAYPFLFNFDQNSSSQTPKFSEAFTNKSGKNVSDKNSEQSLLIWLSESITLTQSKRSNGDKRNSDQLLLSEYDNDRSYQLSNSSNKYNQKQKNIFNCFTFQNIPLEEVKSSFGQSKQNIQDIQLQIHQLLNQNNNLLQEHRILKLKSQQMKQVIKIQQGQSIQLKRELSQLHQKNQFYKQQVIVMKDTIDHVKNSNKGLLIKVRQITHEKQKIQQAYQKLQSNYQLILNPTNNSQQVCKLFIQPVYDSKSNKYQSNYVNLNYYDTKKIIKNYQTVLQFFGVDFNEKDCNEMLMIKISNFHNQVMLITERILQLQDQISQAQKQERKKRQSLLSSEKENKENKENNYNSDILVKKQESLKMLKNNSSTRLLTDNDGNKKCLKIQKSCKDFETIVNQIIN